MQVICIDNKAKVHPDCVGSFMPIEGESYTVTGGFERQDEYFYKLKEDEAGNGWNSIYFIPLSNVENKKLHYEKERV